MLDKFDRPFVSTVGGIIPQKIPSTLMASICESLNLPIDYFHQLLFIEDKAYPNVLNRYGEAQKSKSKSEVLH